MSVNLHAVLPRSRANGPGLRMVVWFQGCSLGCPGCFNPETHSPEPSHVVPIPTLLRQIHRQADQIEGISISGGEPCEQPYGLLALLRGVREGTDLSVLLFSGHTIDEIRSHIPRGPEILKHVDILVAGRYVPGCPSRQPLLSSANQRVHFLTDRYAEGDLRDIPDGELIIGPDGTTAITGVSPPSYPAPRPGDGFTGSSSVP